MTTNQERAAEVLYTWVAGHECANAARALAEHEPPLLMPDPIPLDPGDRKFIIDYLMGNAHHSTLYGQYGMRDAWEAAANAFVAHTTEKGVAR